MKEIKLTQDKIATVDEEDFDLLNVHKWHAIKAKEGIYYAARRFDGHRLYLHRFLMSEPEGKFIDHIDGDTLNNCRSNLRICTHAENNRNNKGYQRQTTSVYKGVSWHKWAGKWRSQISINNKTKFIGLFNSELEAAEAYNSYATKAYGQFANINNLNGG